MAKYSESEPKPLSEMKEIAEEVKDKIKPWAEKIEIGGSIRREKSMPEDIDIVLIPKDLDKLKEEVKGAGWTVKEWGKRRIVFVLGNGIPVNIWIPPETESWGAVFHWITGGSNHNIGVATKAKKKGMKWSQKGLYDRESGDIIPTPTEDDFCRKVMDRECKLPENRSD